MPKRVWVVALIVAVSGCHLFTRSHPAAEIDYSHYCAAYPGRCGGVALGAAAGAVTPASSDVVRFLPWPPPVPSSMVDLTGRVSIQGSFEEVSKRIEARLSSRGYDKLLYYGIPGGFAVTTPLERFDDSGRAVERGRFTEGKIGGWRGVWPYVADLIWGQQGRFRLFVMAVTAEPFTPDTLPPSESDVERWQTTGTLALPKAIGSKRSPARTKVTLLIYEFTAKAGRGGGVSQARDRVPSRAHLRWLGFLR